MLVCLVHLTNFKEYDWDNPKGVDASIYNHPALILDVNGNNVKLLVITTQEIAERSGYVRMQHLPIYPREPHPDTKEQLLLSGGENGDRCRDPSYVKVYQIYEFPKRLLLTNVDKISKRELRLSDESFDYVKLAVARYKRDTPHYTVRPFRGYPKVVDHPDDRDDHPDDPYRSLPKPPAREEALPREDDPAREDSPLVPYSPYNDPRDVRDEQRIRAPLALQSTTQVNQRQQRRGDYGASFGKNGGSVFQPTREKRTSPDYYRPQPPRKPRNGGYGATPGRNRGRDFQESWRDGPSRSSNPRPKRYDPAEYDKRSYDGASPPKRPRRC
ncbi:MAG: hypothetical protein Q9195_005800 [Heterodermia aff. obscurata]